MERRWSNAIQSALDLISIIITSDPFPFFLHYTFRDKVILGLSICSPISNEMKRKVKKNINPQNASAGSTECGVHNHTAAHLLHSANSTVAILQMLTQYIHGPS